MAIQAIFGKVDEVFGCLDLDWRQYVKVDPRYFRPTEVNELRGDASKAHDLLGWEPRVDFAELVRMMIEGDLRLAEQELVMQEASASWAGSVQR